MKLLTTILATETSVLSFQQLHGYMKDLTGEYGYKASAKDLYVLAGGNTNAIYEKLVFHVTGPSPICAISVTKVGPTYTLQASKKNKVEYSSQSCTTLINMVESYKPTLDEININSMKGKNLTSLLEAISKAEKERGKNATVADVFRLLMPNAKIGIGRFCHKIPNYDLYFNGFLGNVICEIVDVNGFKFTTNKARELRNTIS